MKLLVGIAAVACFIASVGYQRAAAQASTTFTISGTIKDTTGAAMADTMVILISDVTGTQITFTDQSGNYALTYLGGVSHNVRVLPSKSGFIFNPLMTIFTSSGSVTGDKTVNFEGTTIPVGSSVVQPPILLTQENSLRALALDSVTLTSEPFSVASTTNFSTDQRTRVSLFVVNLELNQGEPLSVLTAQAEDPIGQIFTLTVEYFGAVPNFSWLKQVVVKLPAEIANSVDVKVTLKSHDTAGNTVMLKVKP
ncbi:MAG: hypothetical protein V7638_1213 [Acidobacteriota bacterium]|jgi:hypothetical protein